MDFFGSIPRSQPPRRKRFERPAWMRPENVAPASVAFERMLVHTPHLAVFTGDVRAYPSGFEFNVHVRRPRDLEHDDDPHQAHPFGSHHPHSGDAPGNDEALRIGVLFADGRRAAADPSRPLFRLDTTPEPPQIYPSRGQGGTGGWEQTFWVWGLPDDGPVTIVYSWSAEGVPESTFELDGNELRAASARATVLWPEESEESEESEGSGESEGEEE
jgi:hypothetical protein